MKMHTCTECGERYAPNRSDSFLCSVACTSRRYRQPKTAAATEEIGRATLILRAVSARADMVGDD